MGPECADHISNSIDKSARRELRTAVCRARGPISNDEAGSVGCWRRVGLGMVCNY